MSNCNCEFCIPCEVCGHKADEHLAGEGNCFLCKCYKHTNKVFDAWDKLSMAEQACTNFKEFANAFYQEVKQNDRTT